LNSVTRTRSNVPNDISVDSALIALRIAAGLVGALCLFLVQRVRLNEVRING